MKNSILKKGALLAGVIAILLIARAFHLHELLNLEQLKDQKEALTTLFQAGPILFLAAYAAIYIISSGLSIPGATVLTLGAGAIFGFWPALLLASFSSTLGATLAFLMSRYLLRDVVERKFAHQLKGVNEGIEREGKFYLLSLRLLPVFPFFLVNLVMGLTKMKVGTYFWVSQAGMLLGTAAYVNAGTQLAQVQSLGGVLSWNVTLSLGVLAVLPLLTRFVVNQLRARRSRQAFPRPRKFDYDIIVIGAGSAGLVSSYLGAALKAKVALIEKDRMGGDCLNSGCVPSKAFIRAAKVQTLLKRHADYGLRATVAEPDFAAVMERVQHVIREVAPHDSVERYTKLGVECLQGEARILTPYSVELGGRVLTTRNIVVATGAGPLVPPIPGLAQIPFLTSDNVWSLRQRPKRLLVLGGGPIGCELAQGFARFGSEVTLVEMAPRILLREDAEVSAHVTGKFSKEGIRVLVAHKALWFENHAGTQRLICERNGQEVIVEFDQVLVALGRKARIKGFGLEELGVAISPRGTIESDPFLRTNYPNIFVCGDVAGPYQFTHTAAHQAYYVVVNALFAPFYKAKVDYRIIPWTTFTDPEVARVGLNEQEAREQGIAHEVTQYEMSEVDRAIAEGETGGFLKVITAQGSDRILGATIVGMHAGDLLAEFVLAMKHGLGLNKILGTIHTYPTLAEANKAVAGAWKKNHAPAGALAFLEKFHTFRRGSPLRLAPVLPLESEKV